MTPEQIKAIAKVTPDIGSVSHADFDGYIIGIKQGGKENPYMSVDGRVMMASLDHIKQGKRLDYGDPVVLVDNDEQITLLVTVTSEIYGKRHGIATSNKSAAPGKSNSAEQASPWEVAETSAIGRALSQFGYGVFAGSGLPSANDMARVETRQNVATTKPAQVENKPEPASNGSAPKATPTERGGLCSKHNTPTHEYRAPDGTLFWGHRDSDNEVCKEPPKEGTIVSAPTLAGGVKK